MQLESESLVDFSQAFMRIHSKMEKAASTQANRTALLRLKDLTLKGQFKIEVEVESRDVITTGNDYSCIEGDLNSLLLVDLCK